MNGQNHIIAKTPLEFLPIKDFEKRQKSIDFKATTNIDFLSSMLGIASSIIAKKETAKQIKEEGNAAFRERKFEEAEKCYSEALKLNVGSVVLWTNRAICRNAMKKYDQAFSDCESALSINSKNSKSVVQKGKALMGMGRFDEAGICFKLLDQIGESKLADIYIKELRNTQEMVPY